MKPEIHLFIWWQAPATVYQVEGAYRTVKPVSLNLHVPVKQQKHWGLLVLEHGLPGAKEAAAVTGELSLQTAVVLRPACQAWASLNPVE
jgi:hypothetical protein